MAGVKPAFTKVYLPFAGGLLPRPPPDGFPVLLGPFGGAGREAAFLAATLLAFAANEPLGTAPPFVLAVAD